MLKAIVYMILSAACFTAINVLVRQVDHLPTFELVFFRSIGTVACCLIVLKTRKIPILGTKRTLLILRGLVGFSSMALFFYAMQLMPLGSAVSLRYLSPFFASALAVWLLKERMVPMQWVFFAAAFAGVVVLKGFDFRISTFALSVVVTSSVLSGMVYVIIRAIGQSEHPVVIVNYFLSISALISGLVCLFIWTPPEGIEWLLLISMGLFGFAAQLFMTLAIQLAEANLITPFKYFEVVFTLLAGWWLFGEYQTALAVTGMGIIVISLLGNVWVKWRAGKHYDRHIHKIEK